ncbi:MAG TPA: hypothetical protein VF046_12920 [Gemmatimonadales bacterium]
MTFKSPIWQPIAILLSAVNLVGVGFAAGAAEPWHAGIHAALGLGFGLWAQRLRGTPRALPADDRLAALEDDMSELRRELAEAQERLDFAERVLAQPPDTRRVGPEQ